MPDERINMNLPRSSFYYIGKQLTVEIYTKESAKDVVQNAEDEILIRTDKEEHRYVLAHPAKLLSFSQNGYKIEVQLATDAKFSVLLKGVREYTKDEKYKAMEQLGLEDGISTDYMDRIRAVYYSSDDKTKEAMVKSYYQSQGTVISSKWESDYHAEK